MYLDKGKLLSLLITSSVIVSCTSDVRTDRSSGGYSGSYSGTSRATNTSAADQLYIVNCVLPGRLRQLGARLNYLGPRRVIKTSGSECTQRGGKYVAHDQSNAQTALKAWLPLAEVGNPEAQSYVGEIYEKGKGTQPNYQQAAHWYQQAVNQGYPRAKINLGSLYERGLGVPKNHNQALDLYKEGSGLAKRQVAFVTSTQTQVRSSPANDLAQSQHQVKLAQKRAYQLQQEVAQLKAEAGRLRSIPAQKTPPQQELPQVTSVKPQVVKANRVSKRVSHVEKKIQSKQKELKQEEEKVTKLTLKSSRNAAVVANPSTKTQSNGNLSGNLRGIDFGRYYAVIIGNDDYPAISSLQTSINDATTVASVLKSQYGFKTIVLSNASRGTMLAAFDTLRKKLTSRDNVIIYFAGHGRRIGKRGFWLPSDARQGDQKSWISNEQVANFIDSMKAKHVLIVADSIYSGTLSRSTIPRPVLSSGKNREWFDAVASTKVRVVMSSGEVKPVDSGSHSVFAKAFLSALRSGDSVIEGSGLFQSIRQQVGRVASTPVYAPIRYAGHEAGDFIFLKGGRVAMLDSSPEMKGQKRISQHQFVIRDLDQVPES